MKQQPKGIVRWIPDTPPVEGWVQSKYQAPCGCLRLTFGHEPTWTFMGLCKVHVDTFREGFGIDLSNPPLDFEDVKLYRALKWEFGNIGEFILIEGDQPMPLKPPQIAWFDDLPDEDSVRQAWAIAWLYKLLEMSPTLYLVAEQLRRANNPLAEELDRLAKALVQLVKDE